MFLFGIEKRRTDRELDKVADTLCCPRAERKRMFAATRKMDDDSAWFDAALDAPYDD